MSEQISTLEQVASKGRDIYERKYRKEMEAQNAGKFVAIDIVTEKAFMANSAIEAVQQAKNNNSANMVHVIRIGDTAAFQVGFLGRAISHSFI